MLFSFSPWVMVAIICIIFFSPFLYLPNQIKIWIEWCQSLRDLILPSFLQLSFSPSTPMNSHVRVICLLVSLLLDCCGLAVVCGLLGASYGMHTLSFMAAEVRAQTVVALHPGNLGFRQLTHTNNDFYGSVLRWCKWKDYMGSLLVLLIFSVC